MVEGEPSVNVHKNQCLLKALRFKMSDLDWSTGQAFFPGKPVQNFAPHRGGGHNPHHESLQLQSDTDALGWDLGYQVAFYPKRKIR
jgi:hypothetical protein